MKILAFAGSNSTVSINKQLSLPKFSENFNSEKGIIKVEKLAELKEKSEKVKAHFS